MTIEGVRRVISLRIQELDSDILYLTDPKVNPPSRHEGETVNEYANGMITQKKHEIDFLRKLFELTA
jgi:hypothetical protein